MIEILFNGLMAFRELPPGQLMVAFLRGLPNNPVPNHVVSVTLQELPGRARPGDVLPFPIPLLLRPSADIYLTVEGSASVPLTFDPRAMITLNGKGFNEGERLEIGDRFFPRFHLQNGRVEGIDNRELVVVEPSGKERNEILSLIVLAQIPFGPRGATLTCGDQVFKFDDRFTKYRLWVSNLPHPVDKQTEQEHRGHFHFYYEFGFPHIAKRYDVTPPPGLTLSVPERPCLGVHALP